MNSKLKTWLVWLLVLFAVALGAAVLSLISGPVAIPAGKIFSLIFSGRGSTGYSILHDIRLPRTLLAFAVGGSLSLAGVLLQGIFRNPLVEPYTLGISGGAALGVCLNIVLKPNRDPITLPLSGFAGSLLVIVFLLLLSRRRHLVRIQGLLLTGVMLSFILSSVVMLLMAVSRTEDLHGIVLWIMGSLEEPDKLLIRSVFFVGLAGLVISYSLWKSLNALNLGEEEAIHLGVSTERVKRFILLLASFLTGCAVAVAGVIGFVGLVIPHLMRLAVGRDHRILLAASFLAGGAFLILCDTLARTVIAPLELPVGVVTGIVGGVVFVYVLARQDRIPSKG